MLALRRFAQSSRAVQPPRALYRAYATANELSGDPGPSTTSFRKQQRSKFRNDTLSGNGRVVSRDALQAVFTADAPAGARASRKPWQARLTEAAQAGRREPGSYRDMRRDNIAVPQLREASARRTKTWPKRERQVAGGESAESIVPNASWRRTIEGTPGQAKERGLDDPYRTSDELRQFIAKHFSSADSVLRADHRDVNAAIAIVTGKPKGAVSVVVWNQLLHLVGRVRQLDKMWSLYNDVSMIAGSTDE